MTVCQPWLREFNESKRNGQFKKNHTKRSESKAIKVLYSAESV